MNCNYNYKPKKDSVTLDYQVKYNLRKKKKVEFKIYTVYCVRGRQGYISRVNEVPLDSVLDT